MIEDLKKNKVIYALGHAVNLGFNKLRVIPASIHYLYADRIHMHINNRDSNTKFLIYRAVGHTGLMTHVLAVLGWIRYAEEQGYTLLVDTSEGENLYRVDNENTWELYFKQPMVDYSVSRSVVTKILGEENYAICPVNVRYNYTYSRHIPKLMIRRMPPTITFPLTDDFLHNKTAHDIYERIYSNCIHFTAEVDKYINDEHNHLLKDKGKILGVLMRGTDYLSRKPYMHKIQPSITAVIDKIEEYERRYGWDYIYLATEDRACDKAIQEAFPHRVIANKRDYDCIPGAEIDDKSRHSFGLEYLSSVYLLSRCNLLIAGQCGGSQAALLMNQQRYEDVFLFELGSYS